eukprot:TRINITY_DN10211_c0_g1_i1.p1 TRINITY_DN10211_c0_g1~~TRINITY_DN10211_c0_g1_i1.p1  ORF type:complete len:200 (-),score=31.87 TRINITY_DN10211_c0_g1_i1:60-599(-)
MDNEPVLVEEAPKGLPHLYSVIFHLLFKILAFLTFLFANLFWKNNFVMPFIFVVIFISFDFWTTKNITGRLLVGLRWWNEVQEDGTNVWIFESLEKEAFIHPIESKLFWGGLFISPLVWSIVGLSQLFTFAWNWAILCGLGVAMNGANVVGYIKCAREAKKKVQKMATEFMVKQAVNNI